MTLSQCRELYHNVWYDDLKNYLKGTIIEVNSLKTLETDILEQVDQSVLSELRPVNLDTKYYKEQINKYGIIDIEFKTNYARIENDAGENGFSILRKHGFLPPTKKARKKFRKRPFKNAEKTKVENRTGVIRQRLKKIFHVNQAECHEYDAVCLKQLYEELKTKKSFFKIFLEQVKPNEELPSVFEVKDACITNVPSIWMFEKFYL